MNMLVYSLNYNIRFVLRVKLLFALELHFLVFLLSFDIHVLKEK